MQPKVIDSANMSDQNENTEIKQLSGQNNFQDVWTFNIGGQRFQTRSSTIRTVNKGFLSKLSEDHPAFDRKTGEFWFDRDPVIFRFVLQYYRTGLFHVEGAHCSKNIQLEMEFWGLTDDEISDCCWRNVCEARERTREFNELQRFTEMSRDLEPSAKGRSAKQQLWEFLDSPPSTTPSKIWFLVSLSLIVLSVACSAVNTLPSVKTPLWEKLDSLSIEDPNCNTTTSLYEIDVTLFYLNVAEAGCLVFFTIDLLLRLLSTPSVWIFMRSFLFFCDVMFLIPGWIIVAVLFADSSVWIFILRDNNLTALVHAVALTRVFRVFRLGWYSEGFRILVLVLKKSSKELLVLGTILLINLTLFGFLIYSVEMRTNPDIDSAFIGFWWAVTTMSTVGYGDVVPITPLGYAIGGACAISGVIVIGLLIPIIASNFRLYYQFQNHTRVRKLSNSSKENEAL